MNPRNEIGILLVKDDPDDLEQTRHASRQGSDVTDSYQPGVNSCIVKPVSFDQFFAAVQKPGMYWLRPNHPPLAKSK